MKLEQIAVAVLISSSMLTPALAQDSNLSRASAASAESIGQTGQSVGWAVHAGSQFTVTWRRRRASRSAPSSRSSPSRRATPSWRRAG